LPNLPETEANLSSPSSACYASLSAHPLTEILRLIRSENVGCITFFQLLERYGTPARAIEAIPELAARAGGKRKPKLASKSDIEKEMEATAKVGARFLMYGSGEYPALLTPLRDAPPVLIAKGSSAVYLQQRCIGMVGARNASVHAVQFAKKLAEGLGKYRITVVSGLARGIDASAHQGALASGTVGVIAGGIDTIYPPENAKLYEAVAAQGCILTEYGYGASPQAHHFPARNRIISGMSEGVIVVEASLKSGSLITARYALEQGREVFAVPGFPADPRARGTNDLIRQGAILTESEEDIILGLRRLDEHAIAEPAASATRFARPFAMPTEQEVDTARKKVMELLGLVPIAVDELVHHTGFSAAALQAALLELELAGKIQRLPGNRVCQRFES
jgi:DNA processing protein